MKLIMTIHCPSTGVIRQLQNEKPGIFGPNGGYSRAYSMTNLSWNIGLLAGPLLSGTLVEAVGYYYMNLTFGRLDFLSSLDLFFPCGALLIHI